MTNKALPLLTLGAALIGAALFFVRQISPEFGVGSTLYDHPYIAFVAALMVSGLVWTTFIWLIPKLNNHGSGKQILFWGIVLGIGLRAMFIGSTSIYENDWNRYLWDGAVVAEGISPYTFSPQEVLYTAEPSSAELTRLQDLSRANNDFANTINYGDLTTIYPPVAQAVFGLGAVIKPFDLDMLRVFFIGIEIFSIFLLIKILDAYGRDRLWALLYALNPLLIYAGFNAVHMDIILVPFLLLSLLWIKTKPHHAAVALAFAGAVKLWPLILAPILYRQWRSSPKTYLVSAAIVSIGFLALMAPLIFALKPNAGVVAYAGEWSRNAFFFPQIEKLFGLFIAEPGKVTRIFVAVFVSGLSVWIGFRSRETKLSLPTALLLATAALFMLSPTGYPWYAIWLLAFVPLMPSYGIAALTVMLPLYYTRYALTEFGLSGIYFSILIPLQFVIPALIIAGEVIRHRTSHAR